MEIRPKIKTAFCNDCGHEKIAHAAMVDKESGDLIAPKNSPCLECGCTAKHEPEITGLMRP